MFAVGLGSVSIPVAAVAKMDDDVVLGLFSPRAEIGPGKQDASLLPVLVLPIPSSRVMLHARLAFPRRTVLRVVLVICNVWDRYCWSGHEIFSCFQLTSPPSLPPSRGAQNKRVKQTTPSTL